ncbi:MAG TPA: cold-shock protein [Candidatus Alistipes avicola]|uniref:Cold-shock protein n=1 Tax=Candidatus Alistipes avicola TaxID=2838432 RepID=A0A9D2IAV7_9BACT|nr:cold-shock protein [uncultured Alistipes sp.]HJA98054.1 cold-shock protein [Candidatus Alistipes avicola]
MTGRVKWFDNKKGYGFITNEDGKDIFVHYTGIISNSFKTLNEGEKVSFELENGAKGEQAINVKAIG